ncbi:MAG: hypothetical protein ACI4NJ_06020 [Cellvibrio sp.]
MNCSCRFTQYTRIYCRHNPIIWVVFEVHKTCL